jgi:large-conductance mechanosensitive channel
LSRASFKVCSIGWEIAIIAISFLLVLAPVLIAELVINFLIVNFITYIVRALLVTKTVLEKLKAGMSTTKVESPQASLLCPINDFMDQ